MPKTNYETIAKGFLNTIKEYGEINAEKARIQSAVFANEFQAKRNFLWNIKEKEAERQSKLKFIEEMQKRFEQQNGNGMDENEGFNINTPQVRIGAGGEPTLNYPSTTDKEFAIKYRRARIKNKQEREMAITDQEKKFMELYPEELKTTGKPTQWDLQKEARTTVNSMLQNNPELQGKVFENSALLTDLIDKEVERLQSKYIDSARSKESDWKNFARTNPDIQKWYSQLPESKQGIDVVDFMKQQKQQGIYDYEKAISQKLFPSYQTEHKEYRWNDIGKGVKNPNISLPSEIKTTTQAVDYLIKNYNMTKEQAIEWIRNQ